MKGLISRLALMLWVGYMGVVLGSVLSRIAFGLGDMIAFVLGLIFGSSTVLLFGWTLALLVSVIFNDGEGAVLDLVWVALAYWFGFFAGMLFRVV